MIKYGRLRLVNEKDYIDGKIKSTTEVEVICDCGTKKFTKFYNLTSGDTKSCGCLRRELCRRNIQAQKEFYDNLITEELIDDFKNGINCKTLAKKYGIDKSTLRLRLKKLGYDTSVKIGEKNWKFTGYKEIYGRDWDGLQWGAKRRNLEFTITKEYAWEILEKQNKKCAFSGVILTFHKHSKDRSGTASIDRIDSTKGYVEGNIQWIHKKFQNMKRDLTDEQFIDNCIQVANYKFSKFENIEYII